MSHFCIIDGGNIVQRAWAMADKQQDADGVEIGAAKLFGKMIPNLLRRMQEGKIPPRHAAIAFDPPREGTWRRALYPGYKANRPDQDPDLTAQIVMMREMCEFSGLAQAMVQTHEADDVIAALTMDARARKMRVSIISDDKDLMQLVRPGILQFDPARDIWYNVDRVTQKFGVPPDLMGDFLGLMGDSSDGVPGCPGIGTKIAADLLNRKGSLDAVLDDPECTTRPLIRKNLVEFESQIRISRKLVRLDIDDCPRPFTPDQVRTPDAFETARIMREYIEMRVNRPSTENDLTLD